MAISQTQIVDYLNKKVGYGVAKTDTSTAKSPSNESNASPLLSPGSTIWQQDYSIPSVTTLPSSNSSVVTVYRDSLSSTIRATNLAESTTNQTWATGLTNWVPTQFGAGYQVQLYAAPAGNSAPQTYGVSLPQAGSGNNDSWFFDYQAGIVNFADTNVPTAVTWNGTTGNVVYVVGARYTGLLGLYTQFNTITSNIGNVQITGSNVNATYGNLTLNVGPESANNLVILNTTSAVNLPSGNTAMRPADASGGTMRYNTDNNNLELYVTNTGWVALINQITTQTITPDGINSAFTLNAPSTTTGVIVSINGTLQQPSTAYNVSGSTITFAQVPLQTDIIEIRNVSAAISGFPGGNISLPTSILANTVSTSTTTGALTVTGGVGIGGNAYVGGNLVISGNVQIASTTGTPTNTSTPAAWLKVQVGASYYYQPLYQ